MNNNPITTHILDTSLGKPAANVDVELYVLKNDNWLLLSSASTDQNGRVSEWQDNSWHLDSTIESLYDTYKLVFNLSPYWQEHDQPTFYPSADVIFILQDTRHHHIPLLLNAFGYSTYRGS